jgi:ubiquinone/menaquinone biosynthesis C-methylase UbiE
MSARREVVMDTKNKVQDQATQLHGMWASVADAWGENADYVDARGVALTEQMLEHSALQPGERVLELACAAAGLGLAAAKQVGPEGEVVLSDVVPEMTAIADARAKGLGVTNVSTLVLDIERIDQPDGSFDAVLCREGLMFALDPAHACGEIRRVLRPGGRAAVAVWGPRERNPWLGLVLDSVSTVLGMEVPPPGIPGPFALDDATELAVRFTYAGFAGVAVDEIPVPMRVASFDEWFTRTLSLAGPLATIVESLPEETSTSLRARLEEAVHPYETADGLDFPGVSLLATGSRPSA